MLQWQHGPIKYLTIKHTINVVAFGERKHYNVIIAGQSWG